MESKLLLDLAIILFATKIFGLLTRKIHLPQVVGALLTGIVFGPALLGIIELNSAIGVIAEIGVLLIMFEAGLETDLKRLRKSIGSLLVIAACGIALSLGGGFALSALFGRGLAESMFLGVIIMSSSIGITVEALQEMGKLKSKTGTAILGVSAVEDLFTIVIFSLVIGMSEGAVTLPQIGTMLLSKVLFFALAAVLGLITFKVFEYITLRFGYTKRLSIFGLAFCFLMAFTADKFGLAGIMGAYIAGLVLCNSKAERFIESRSNILSFMFFSPMFFGSVGLQMSFDALSGEANLFRTVAFTVLFILIAILSKLGGCAIGARLCKFNKSESLQIGSGMVARCEFPVVAAVVGTGLGLVDEALFSIIIIMVLSTALIAPILLKVMFRSSAAQQ